MYMYALVLIILSSTSMILIVVRVVQPEPTEAFLEQHHVEEDAAAALREAPKEDGVGRGRFRVCAFRAGLGFWVWCGCIRASESEGEE